MAQQAFTQSFYGKYFVLYPDGAESACMRKHTAYSYSRMFGGSVHRHPDYPTIWQRLKQLFQ